jgi:hypothetical protein
MKMESEVVLEVGLEVDMVAEAEHPGRQLD